ncbi:hypothetical protein E2C01_089123 [Portunus trituberculatus]|uniref:Uncharacterized protein n=1 Tax=Portunus trituberculatus TaxID=210409 RepID=A0A5B7JHA5_PORTR|nr:hypothetical protein [Portunus trituberculatus]
MTWFGYIVLPETPFPPLLPHPLSWRDPRP